MFVGEYSPEITEDIWVSIGLPGGTRFWPQSPNACEGQPALKLNGQWEVRAFVGSPDDNEKLFEIIINTADDEASRFISQTLQTWCQQGSYPGFSRGELPDGLVEHQRITVKRGTEASAPSPDISNLELPGQVNLERINSGDVVPQSLVVSGAYTDAMTNRIWVLVYAPDGRYYPQSTNACEGISTIQLDGLWEAKIGLGGDGDVGESFDIIVVLANEDAHATFEARQQGGCETKEYPGYLFIELPRGIDQKAIVSVIRQ
jgi:hypothetical protein